LPRFWQTVLLKDRNQIVREPNNFQVKCVGRKRGCGNLTQGKVFSPFTNPRFHSSTPVVEVPNTRRRQIHVGHPGAKEVAPQAEKRTLFFLVARNESSPHYETTCWGPTVGTMLALSHLPLLIDKFIAQARQQSLEIRCQSGYDGILRGSGFQLFQDGVETKTGTRPNSELANVSGMLAKQVSSNSTLPSQVPVLPGRSSVSHKYEELASMHKSGW
jgi:hypothetical protein